MAAFASPAALVSHLQADVDLETAKQALDLVSGAIRGLCGWSISQESVTGLRVSGLGRKSLWLPTLHLTSVDSVVEDGVALTEGVHFDWTSNGRLLRNRSWSASVRSITVAFTHGYPAGHAVLDSVAGVCLSAAARLVDNPTSRRSGQLGPEAWTAAGPGDEVVSILARGECAQLAPWTLPMVA